MDDHSLEGAHGAPQEQRPPGAATTPVASEAPPGADPARSAGCIPWRAGLVTGPAVMATLFGFSLLVHADAEYMGVRNEALTEALTARHGEAILRQQLGLLGLALGVGAVLGLLAALTAAPLLQALRPRPRTRVLLLVGLVLWLHEGLLLESMARHPAIYAPGADQSVWIAASLAVAVDGPPAPVRLALFAAPLAGALFWWARQAVSRWARAGQRRRLGSPRVLVMALGGTGAGLAVALALSLPASKEGGPPSPHVLLVAVDSLRADHLGANPAVTPHLDALALNGQHFTRAVPAIPRTYPSWASMLTGQYPHHHGIRHMFPIPDAAGQVRVQNTLSSILRAKGYRTAAFSDFAGDIFTRADFGFDHVEAPAFTLASNVALGGLKPHLHLMPWLVEVFAGRTHPEMLAFERLGDPFWVTDRARDFIADMAAREPETPWFVVVFLSSGHFPFASPTPYWEAFTDPDYRGPSRFHKESFGGDFDAPERAAETAHLRHLHAGAISASDAAIGELFGALDETGLAARTVRVVTADHGECLYEHGLGTGHGDHLYGRGTLEVPLIIAAAGLPPRTETAPVSLTDLSPTVLGALGLTSSAPPETIAGRDLVRSPPEALAARAVFSETDLWFHPPETRRLEGRMLRFAEGLEALTEHPESGQIHLRPELEPAAIAAKHRAILTVDRKLLYIPTRDGVRLELYAPRDDPGDSRDLASAEPGTRDALATRLYAWMRQDPAVEERLGFILPRLGSGVAPAAGKPPDAAGGASP
jgi:arylsulfatase A-like enzyme